VYIELSWLTLESVVLMMFGLCLILKIQNTFYGFVLSSATATKQCPSWEGKTQCNSVRRKRVQYCVNFRNHHTWFSSNI